MRRSTRALVVTFGAVAVVVAGGLSAAAFAGTGKPRPVPSVSTAVPVRSGTASPVPASPAGPSASATAAPASPAGPSASATAAPASPAASPGGPTASALPVTR
jgi:hypothetical protein